MNQNIIKYFNDNKKKYSREILIAELEKAGYKKEEIAEAAIFIYEPPAPPRERKMSLWNDLRAQKVYIKTSEKIIDFLSGFFLGGFVVWTIVWFIQLIIGVYIMLFSPIIYILALIYFFKRRKYIFYGLLAELLIPIAGFLFFILIF